jgi:hypothetical protein
VRSALAHHILVLQLAFVLVVAVGVPAWQLVLGWVVISEKFHCKAVLADFCCLLNWAAVATATHVFQSVV